MAQGWDAVQQAAAAQQEQQAQYDAQRKPTLSVNQNNPGPIQIRFLEQGPEVHNYPVHDYKVPSPQGGFFNKNFTCLSEVGQECPGCKAGLKQKRRGVFNVIQRNRPVLRKGADGKALRNPDNTFIIDGYQDEVVVASVGQPTAEMLRQSDGSYQGLMSRDFVVTFSGNKFQAWNLTPAMDATGNSIATPMSEADMALAAQKHNLDEFMKPPSQQEAQRIVNQYGGNSGASPNAGAPAQGTGMAAPQANQFATGAPVPATGGAFAGAQQVAAPPPAALPVPPIPQQQPVPQAAPPQQAPPQPVAPPPAPVPVAAPQPVAPPPVPAQ